MRQLLSTYTAGQILLFLVMTAIAIKEVISFFDWSKERMTKEVDKTKLPLKFQQQLNKLSKEHENDITKIEQQQTRIGESIAKLDKKLNILIASDMDDIKAWITAQHHHFTEKGYIDYYSLDCITRRYEDYKIQGGNTFIDELMEEIENLPKTKKEKEDTE